MADIDLNFFVALFCSSLLFAIYDVNVIASKLFADFEETFFYLSFDLWLQLFLHVV